MGDFNSYKDNAKPKTVKPSDLAASKEVFCIMGTPEFFEGSYQGKQTYQHRVTIIRLIDGKKNSDTVFFPGSTFWQNFFSGLDDNPEYRHNLYLSKDGNAYDINQKESGICPCGKNHVSRETQASDETEDIDGILAEYGFNPVGNPITNKQKKIIALLAPGVDTSEFTEQDADEFIDELRKRHAGLTNGK